MSPVPALVVAGPGTNRDRDLALALQLAGADPVIVLAGELAAEPDTRCIWTAGLDDELHCPIAHGEGRYVHPDPAQLEASGQVALRYRSANPNGSVAAIAGVCNAAGNVLGLMPHPENHLIARQHPHPPAGGGRHLGLRLFRNGVAAAREM